MRKKNERQNTVAEIIIENKWITYFTLERHQKHSRD
jgi:hypothetical protein